jgi:transcriptional regulator with XRE-family HTH domain
MTPFAQFIKEAREDQGLSLTEAAELVGCTKSYLWDMEQGRATNPTITILVGLAKALDLYLDNLAMVAAMSINQQIGAEDE